MVAQKIDSAINEQSVANRLDYKRILIVFGSLYSLSVVFFILMIMENIFATNVEKKFEDQDNDAFLKAAATFAFCFILFLSLAYLRAFRKMSIILKN
jgi:hypothetical protein